MGQRVNPRHRNGLQIGYLVACVFLGAGFLRFVAAGVGGTSDAILFAQRAATIFRACALRSSGVSFVQASLATIRLDRL